MSGLRLDKSLLWTLALLAATAIAGLNLNAKEGEMPKKIMMYYGGFEIEEMFDATQWFASGMYRPRTIEADGSASKVTLLRSKPAPFKPEHLNELPYVAAGALDEKLEEADLDEFLMNPPALNKRIRYAYSAFAEPNKPEDYYHLFLELGGKRYAVTFSRDAQTGDILPVSSAKEVIDGSPAHAEFLKVFAEIEAAEREAP
ncbi:hypothetical protein ACX0MV_02605 [Pseudomonas borbori]